MEDWAERAEKLSKKIFMATEWLYKETDLKRKLKSLEIKMEESVTYHDACHAKKVQNIYTEPRELLKDVYELKEMSDSNRCCGFGGVTMQTEKYHLAELAGKPKAQMIKDTEATVVSAECSACRMQINNSLYQANVNVVFQNPIELIAKAFKEGKRLKK